MTSRLEQGSVVTVLGGSGFLGRHAVRGLAAEGWRIRGATRRPDLAGYLQPMGAVGQIYPVQANLRYPDSLRQAVDGATAVVNLVGILAECRLCLSRAARQSFHAVHVAGARAAARAAKEAGARTFVHVSAIGADRTSWARYARTKAAGEAAVLAEFPTAVILRPSVVFGPEDQLFNRFAAMAALPLNPFLPLIGGGKTRFQPVYVGDVAAAIAAACGGKAKARTIYELGGPDVVTFRQLLDLVQEWSGRRKWYLPVPFWAAQVGAFLTSPLPQSLRPITVDQVRMLTQPNVVSEAAIKEGRTLRGLGIAAPHAMASVVPQYLERFRPYGQFARYDS
ncbi:MAG TPA: complex I NDUFA9 subunit family protein [Hyphomicrobiaceae bacterium]|nr:complex I NDUFA9 subunit family protein [Hyphomicrobiaceae bacterium]